MDYMYLTQVEGLFHEFSLPEKLEESNELIGPDKCILDDNNAFWAELLSERKIYNLIECLENNKGTKWADTPQYLSIIADKYSFVDNILQAKHDICDHNISEKQFFSCLESLTILCKLYSDIIFYPYVLDLQNGFLLDDYSAFQIYEDCLNISKNPYLEFINKYTLPKILKYKPKLIFIQGKISFYNMAVAKLVKIKLPDTHICVTRHSTEYYSINKITKYIINNKYLFNMIDSIILEYFSFTEKRLISTINDNKDIHYIGNMIYKNNDNKIQLSPNIVPDKYPIDIYQGSPNQYDDLVISPQQVADVRIEPFVKCHWNKCTFCGINKKYSYVDGEYSDKQFTEKLIQIKKLYLNGVKFLWFIDEAIPTYKLKKIAEYFVNEKLYFKWQARCRISNDLLNDELIELLKLSGLTEIRMGLESASLKILMDMNKFDDDFSLELVEKIVKTYSNNGISVHFPMIIGYPTENNIERKKTFDFLSDLKEKYPNFSFNINIFHLDIASQLFKNWSESSVMSIDFPCNPNDYLGNWLNYNNIYNHKNLYIEQDQYMREKLYPWMPQKSIIKPHIFYRLSESARNTLIWKSINKNEDLIYYYSEMWLVIEEKLTFSYIDSEETYLIYNWRNHHYVKGNENLINVINEWKKPHSLVKGVNNLVNNIYNNYTENDLIILIKKLIYYQFLVETDNNNDKNTSNNSVKDFYNNLYATQDFPYRIQSNLMIPHYKDIIPKGMVLDLGIGMGKDIDYLLSEGYQITGVDFSEISINKLKEKYKSSNCVFINDDITKFNIQPSTYSLIICSLILSHLTEKQIIQLSRKIIAGLIPGGCLFFSDLSDKDMMLKLDNDAESKRRFFTREQILELFCDLETVEITDSFIKEQKRIDYGGYFGILNYIGKK